MSQTNDSQPNNPVIVFSVNLTPVTETTIGPLTNSRTTGILSPDRFQSSPDQAFIDMATRDNYISTWLPGLLDGENRKLKAGDTFTVKGEKAYYIKQRYTTGTNPILSVVSES